MIPVILSGGIGSRLWPLSREEYPKQLQALTDPNLTMIQQAVLRAEIVAGAETPIVVCNEQHRFLVGEQLNQLAMVGSEVLLEPEGRNTAPAIAIAAWACLQRDPDAVMLVMPADHIVSDEGAFKSAVAIALEYALNGRLVTFGVVPTGPETGYGYIKAGNVSASLTGNGGGFDVHEFKEKPTLSIAQKYVDSGDYYWNGGIFLFRADQYLNQLNQFVPDVYAATKDAFVSGQKDLDFFRVQAGSFLKSPNISIDYAVMERTNDAVVVPLDAGWSDVGSWDALWEASAKDADGNVIYGDVVMQDTKNSQIYAESKLVATIGIDELVVVQTADAVLVADRKKSQDVKNIVSRLQQMERSHIAHHRKVYRPWGWYDSIDVGERFQVKRISVKPQAKLSVQLHHHRAEHWVVVKGEAEVLNGEDVIFLTENQSTYIPIGVKHALKNTSVERDLEIIEVQSGAYLGEDDIVRFEDIYGREGGTN